MAPVDIVSRDHPHVDDAVGRVPLPRHLDDVRRAEDALRLTAAPRGLLASAFSRAQQGQVRALLRVYLERLPDELAAHEADKIAGDRLLGVHLAWAGSTEPGRPHHYRLRGHRLLVEYDNTQREVNHIHTVWRDPDGDFADDVLAEHRAAFHHT